MSTDYQTYSQTYPQNTGFAMPQMVPMGSPMFQPLPMTGLYFPQVSQQLPCGFQAMPMGAAPAPPAAMLPIMSGCSSLDSLAMSDALSVSMGMSDKLSPAPNMSPENLSLPAMASGNYSFPLCQVGMPEAFPRSPSPNAFDCPSPNAFNMMPSHSPQLYPMLPMISLIPTTQSLPDMQTPMRIRTDSSITITNPPAADPVLPEVMTSDPNLLGYRDNSAPRSRSNSLPARTRSLSRGRSLSDCSYGSETERDYERTEPSKRELVNRAFAKLKAMFGNNFDQNGNRGENILRLKVKTRTALERIVPLIEFCQQENLITSVSCPISTKKGRQQVRGFLAYLQMKDAKDADRVEELIELYNKKNGSPFNTWHRNPPSTWKKTQI